MSRGPLGTATNSPRIDRDTLNRRQSSVKAPLATKNTAPTAGPLAALVRQLPAAVDGVPELRGAGIIVISEDGPIVVRKPAIPQRRYVVAQVGTVSAGLTPEKKGEEKAGAIWDEAANLGFNCVGATLSWVGVAATVVTAPATGGVSLAGGAWLATGAAAGTYQCYMSVVRVRNEYGGNHAANEAMDKDPTYVNSMRAADAIGLASAAGGIKGVVKAGQLARGYGGIVKTATQPISRPARKVFTEGLELVGKRQSTATINTVMKHKLLEGIGGGIGAAGSAYGGLIKESIGALTKDMNIWIFSPPDDQAPP